MELLMVAIVVVLAFGLGVGVAMGKVECWGFYKSIGLRIGDKRE
jgi:hypothetical protein